MMASIQTIATDYLRTIGAAMLAIEVTDKAGTRLLLDAASGEMVRLLLEVRTSGKKAIVIGNGGSAGIAAHIHNDLSKAVGVRALNFLDIPLLTALSNDCGYVTVYETPIKQWADPGDLLIAISSSGRSQNILRAAEAAASRGCEVVTFSGFTPDNPLRRLGRFNFHVPFSSYGAVEIAHAALGHYLTDAAAQACAAGANENV